MPKVGETRKAKELGYAGHADYIYEECPICQVPRWVRVCVSGIKCRRCSDKAQGEVRRLQGREVKLSSELGYNFKRERIIYQDFCPNCGKEIWRLRRDQIGHFCKECNTMELAERSKNQTLDKHPRFTGYRKIHRQSGYIQIVLPPDHPFYAMATKSDHRVMEHRLVMAEFLGRSLEPWEVVHHINGIKDDNRIENLELLPRQTEHIPSIFMEQRIRALEKQVDELQGKVTILEAENVLLRAQGLK